MTRAAPAGEARAEAQHRESEMTEFIPAWIGGRLVPVPPDDVHRRGLRHRAVAVFLLHGRQVLLLRRAAGTRPHGGLWSTSCCHHPRWGEAAEDCAIRSLQRDLGLDGAYPAHAGRIEHRSPMEEGMRDHEVVDIHLAYLPDGRALRPDPDSIDAIRWVDPYDLAAETGRHPERFAPWLCACLPQHIEQLAGAALRD